MRAEPSAQMPYCGGPLHSAHYQRKPRGGPPDLCQAYEMRFSLCCGRAGCRRRILPPSVRFWARRVYWAPVILLVSALRQGQNPDITLERLKGLCGVWRSTVRRWQRYFLKLFPHTMNYRRLTGHLMPPISTDSLPGDLLIRFDHSFGNPETALIQCLRTLALGP
jgi:hypothetical protein